MPDGEEKGPDIIPANIINRAYYSGEDIFNILHNFKMSNILDVFLKRKYPLNHINFVRSKKFLLLYFGNIIFVVINNAIRKAIFAFLRMYV